MQHQQQRTIPRAVFRYLSFVMGGVVILAFASGHARAVEGDVDTQRKAAQLMFNAGAVPR